MFFTLVPMCELVHCEAIIGAMALQQPWLRPRSLEEATKVIKDIINRALVFYCECQFKTSFIIFLSQL